MACLALHAPTRCDLRIRPLHPLCLLARELIAQDFRSRRLLISLTGRFSIEVVAACPRFPFGHEGVDPPIRRLDRVRACIPGIDWFAAARRSGPGERSDFRGNAQELGIAIVLVSAVLTAILGSTIGFWIGDRHADACGSLDRFRPRRKPLVAARSIAVSAIAQLRYAANLGLAALMLDTHGRS